MGFASLYPSYLLPVYSDPRPSHHQRMDSRQHAPLPINPAGDLLRGWRNRRAMSQADLAFETGISIKHLSYVETGKAAGSRDILLQLASALGLSLRDRNALLEAGGFARQYGERDLSAPEVADAKRAIDLLLRRHEPFPAIVTDRRWNVMQANRAAVRLMTMLLGEARMTRPHADVSGHRRTAPVRGGLAGCRRRAAGARPSRGDGRTARSGPAIDLARIVEAARYRSPAVQRTRGAG